MRFCAANGMTIAYEMRGSAGARPLVFVSSLGTDLRIWDDVVSLLSSRYLTLTYDKRGHGLSDAPPGDYRLDDHVDDLIGLVDELGFETFSLVGVSVGGLISQRCALKHGTRVQALVLCSTAAKIGSAEAWNERIEHVRSGDMAALAEPVMDRWFSPEFQKDRPIDLRGWRNMFLRSPPAGYAATCATVRDSDLSKVVSAIAAPTLVVAGSEDRSTPPELVQSLASAIPGAQFELISGSGHLPSIEQPVQLAGIIERFLKDVGYV